MSINSRKGFTLIELLVVIAIIALLSTLAVVALGSTRKKANDTKRFSDIKQIQTALELYYTEHQGYPVTAANGIMLGDANTSCLNASGFAARGCTTPYMQLVPRDPSGTVLYQYRSLDGKTYTIDFTLESGVDSVQLGAGATQATPSQIKNK